MNLLQKQNNMEQMYLLSQNRVFVKHMKKFSWNDLHNDLENSKEGAYKEFSQRISPNIKMLGVRIPLVRKIALRYLKEYATEELLSTPLPDNPYLEEKLCKAIFIGRAKIDEKERIALVKEFLSYIDGWAICDGFCSELKTCKDNHKLYYPLITKCFKEQSSPFTLRFACVMALMYFSDVKYEDEIVSYLNNINTEEYYVHMGVAWLIATLYTKNGPAVLDKVNNISLDDKTYNKALQKITESNYVSKETKAQIRKMKRK